MVNNRSNKKQCKWSEQKYAFFSTLLATLIGVLLAFGGAYWISENQKSAAAIQAEKGEVDSVVQLLEVAQKDVNRSINTLNQIQNPIKRADRSKTDKGKSEALKAIDAIFTIAVPYPIAFEKILNDDRVIRNLSDAGLLDFYSAQARLDSQRTHMLNPCTSADKRLASMKWYKRDLELINNLLKYEVEYQKGDIPKNEMLDRYGAIQANLSKLTTAELKLLIKDEDRNSLCEIVRIKS